MDREYPSYHNPVILPLGLSVFGQYALQNGHFLKRESVCSIGPCASRHDHHFLIEAGTVPYYLHIYRPQKQGKTLWINVHLHGTMLWPMETMKTSPKIGPQ